MHPKLFVFSLKSLLALSIAGAMISFLHQHDVVLMLILAFFTVVACYMKRNSKSRKIYFLGLLLSAGGGVLAENWGINSGLWTYHDLPDGREFPYWLPFAWALAFAFLYRFEVAFIKQLKIKTLQSKIVLTLLVSAILPTIGEIITVQFGVWTYAGDYKIFGIPLYAIGLLMLFHTATFLILYTVNLRWKITDAVFTRPSAALDNKLTS